MRHHLGRRACVLTVVGAAVLLGAAGPDPDSGPACFPPGPGEPPSLEIYQQAPPPMSGRDEGFAYFPATAFATQSMERIWRAQPNRYRLYYYQWANRGDAQPDRDDGVRVRRGSKHDAEADDGVKINHKANFEPGEGGALDQRASFTTTDKADACTLAQTAAILGLPHATVDGYVDQAGVTPVRLGGGGRIGVPDAVDVCVIPPRSLPPWADGVMLDYEVQDDRSPSYTLAFLTRFSELVRSAGKSPLLLTNPLDAPTQRSTGISIENANLVHHLFDRLTLFAWSGNRQADVAASLDNQWATLQSGGPVDPRRLIVDFELAGTTEADAAAVRSFITAHHIAGVFFWRNGASQGGDCGSAVNQRIACVAFGRCAGDH